MATQKKTKKKNRVIVRLLLIVVVAFCFLKLVQIQTQMKEKQAQIDQLHGEIATAELYNEDLSERNKNDENSIEQRLRENGYVYSYDQVYQFAN